FFFSGAVELIVFATTWLPSVDLNKYPIYPQNPICSFLASDTTGSRFVTWREASLDPYILANNLSNVFHINDVHGYESLTPRSMTILLREYERNDTLDLRLLGLSDVRYIVVGKRPIDTTNLRKVFAADSLTIYENLLAKPRAYMAYSSQTVSSDSEVIEKMYDGKFDGRTALFVKENIPQLSDSNYTDVSQIRYDRLADEEIRLTVETQRKGMLILTDTYYPGWQCYINGEEVPIFRANYSMRAVPLQAGSSSVVFKFEPKSFRVGWMISAASSIIWIIGFLFLRRKP
ncbi:MAG: YfhO family protein, partial [Ignavibacteriota bacterium]